MVIVGIDGGLTGAIAFLFEDPRLNEVLDLPTLEMEGGGTVRRRIDVRALSAQLTTYAKERNGGTFDGICACIEALATGGSTPGRMNAMTQNSQHRTRGQIEATLELRGLALQEVNPLRWKALYGLKKKEKRDSLVMARDLFPELAQSHLRLAAHHNRAEALLIAHYARKVLA
jgi:hypothetical protein